MANIGSFKKVGSDFQGEIVTLSLQTKGVRIVPRGQPVQRQCPQPSGLRGPGRDRGGLVEALQRGSRLSLAQARRPELQRADLRQPLQRRGRRGLHPDLVAPQQAQRRLSRTSSFNAPPGPPGGAFACPLTLAGLSPGRRGRSPVPVPLVAPKQEPSRSISTFIGVRVRTSYPPRAPYPRRRAPSIPRSRPRTFLRQARCGPSGCRIARTLPPTLHAGLQRLSRRDSGLRPIAPRLHPR